MGLYALAQAGDPKALGDLVRQHLPLVQALSRRFPLCEDAFQQGCLGLVKAIRRFQEDAGYQFSTYAVPVILGEMRRAQNQRLGWRSRAALNRARAYQEKQMRQKGQMPGVQEIAAHAGLTPEELTWLMEWNKGPIHDETGTMLTSFPDPLGEQWLLRFCILDVLSRLPQEESWLIRQRFVLGKSQTELAQALHTSQSRVSRQEKQARLHFQSAWNEAEGENEKGLSGSAVADDKNGLPRRANAKR